MASVFDENRYVARILRHVDADTSHAEVALGFDVTINLTVRWEGINAPELHTPEGKQAVEYLRRLLPEGTEAILATRKSKKEKYGRYLGTFWLNDCNLNKKLIEDGFAVPYMVEK